MSKKENDSTLWGIHAGKTGDAASLFLKHDCVALGWQAIGDLSVLGPDREAFKAAVAHAYPNKKPGAIPNNAGQLYRFVHEMKESDLVVFPNKNDRKINIGMVAGDYAYGFPFDHPHLAFAERIRRLHEEAEQLRSLQLRGEWKDNKPYFKICLELQNIINDRTLWKNVAALQEKITIFEKLRGAMRIAPNSSRQGLNDEGAKGNTRTIEKRVEKFRA